MEVQNKNNIRVILYVLVLIAVFSIIFLIFKIEISNEKLEKNKVGLVDENTILPTPDRIIYKNINNEYIIINSGTSAYTQIYSELYNRITNTIEGKVYLEDKISQMQNNGSFIEFDYNSKSKNYVFMLNEKEIGIIKRFSLLFLRYTAVSTIFCSASIDSPSKMIFAPSNLSACSLIISINVSNGTYPSILSCEIE